MAVEGRSYSLWPRATAYGTGLGRAEPTGLLCWPLPGLSLERRAMDGLNKGQLKGMRRVGQREKDVEEKNLNARMDIA